MHIAKMTADEMIYATGSPVLLRSDSTGILFGGMLRHGQYLDWPNVKYYIEIAPGKTFGPLHLDDDLVEYKKRS